MLQKKPDFEGLTPTQESLERSAALSFKAETSVSYMGYLG